MVIKTFWPRTCLQVWPNLRMQFTLKIQQKLTFRQDIILILELYFSCILTCSTDGVPRTAKWWNRCMAEMRWAGPIAHPIFQPVTLKVLPALPIVIVRSAIPLRVAAINTRIFYFGLNRMYVKNTARFGRLFSVRFHSV